MHEPIFTCEQRSDAERIRAVVRESFDLHRSTASGPTTAAEEHAMNTQPPIHAEPGPDYAHVTPIDFDLLDVDTEATHREPVTVDAQADEQHREPAPPTEFDKLRADVLASVERSIEATAAHLLEQRRDARIERAARVGEVIGASLVGLALGVAICVDPVGAVLRMGLTLAGFAAVALIVAAGEGLRAAVGKVGANIRARGANRSSTATPHRQPAEAQPQPQPQPEAQPEAQPCG